MALSPGIYEQIITEALDAQLNDDAVTSMVPRRAGLLHAEAADRLALHLARIVELTIDDLPENQRVAAGTALVRRLLGVLIEESEKGGRERIVRKVRQELPLQAGVLLKAIEQRMPDGSAEAIAQPCTQLLDTALLTNAPDEPGLGMQIRSEIPSADRVDAVIAFIRYSGIAPLLDGLRAHCAEGRELRVLTTTYTGSTEPSALDALEELGAQIRVSYDTTGTRLHAKAWVFQRDSGFSTAFIGSSNLTRSAQVTGLEWNVRASGVRNPDLVAKMEAVFESYWNSPDFVPYDRETFLAAMATEKAMTEVSLDRIELRLEPFQERLLERIKLSRFQGHHRNLLVAATGTGKTVMAAVDYARLRVVLPRARLLFIAHREEILVQSHRTFRRALRDHSFGELWVAGERPKRFEHVFASIQSLTATGFEHLSAEHFDVVIIDEFHHAAARSYQRLLEHVRPRELLGLTATPERGDGLPILGWFDGRIAAELRLWDAIEQHRLVPFAYYGVHDGIDLRQVPWKRGRGYEIEALSNVLTADGAVARLVLKELLRRVGDISRVRALGFCVSVSHARFMAQAFQAAGVAAVAVWGDSPEQERKEALERLARREINVVFSVDLFNEGVDVPTVDTLLMLRPTDSPTLFLQQLGRGLRKAPEKGLCTVLDFVGLHRAEFRFDRRYGALLGGSRKWLTEAIDKGFPFLPAGCHMELDAKASAIVLASIRTAIPTQWSAKVAELKALTKGGQKVSLAEFLDETGLTLEDVYLNNKSWSELCEDAGLAVAAAGPFEPTLRRACGRLLHVDDRARLHAYREFLVPRAAAELASLSVAERRLLRMLLAQVTGQASSGSKGRTLEEAAELLWSHPQVCAELGELFDALEARIEHVTTALTELRDVPVCVHARYTRIEIMAGFGVGDETRAKVTSWQTGVWWAENALTDLLAFTLDKTEGHFSPKTRYRDYAINAELIHWESQNVTRAQSETGLRYQTHRQRGSLIMLFARVHSDERAFYFLGAARYEKHVGEMPMAVTWRLEVPLPGDLFSAFAAAVA